MDDHESRGLIDAIELTLSRDARGRLQARDRSGHVFEDVTPLRLFPHSDPHHWIALIDHDGRELSCINDPGRLDMESTRVLNEELTAREFVPLIKRIVRVSGNSVPCEWKVETDRGATAFVVNDEKDVRRLGPFTVLVVDAHGIRYVISDYRQLDVYGRRVVEWYV